MNGRIFKVVAALLLGLIGQLAQAGTVTYVYTDPQGTPLADADASGNITATFDYKPYGSQVLGTPKAGPGYTGHVNDPDTGFIYMQARYYDPDIGRFLSDDPVGISVGDIFGFNRLAYVNNNPVMHVDLSGMSCGGNGEVSAKIQARRDQSDGCFGAGMSFRQKLQRNFRWFRESISVQLGARLGLNARIKVGKLGRLELGTGYIGEGGEMNANFDYAQIYAFKGPSLALQLGRLKLGAEAGGSETRTPISIAKGMSIEESRTKGFLFGGIESKHDWNASQGAISVEINPVILHGEVSFNITGIMASALYWEDGNVDPTK